MGFDAANREVRVARDNLDPMWQRLWALGLNVRDHVWARILSSMFGWRLEGCEDEHARTPAVDELANIPGIAVRWRSADRSPSQSIHCPQMMGWPLELGGTGTFSAMDQKPTWASRR